MLIYFVRIYINGQLDDTRLLSHAKAYVLIQFCDSFPPMNTESILISAQVLVQMFGTCATLSFGHIGSSLAIHIQFHVYI